MYVFYRVYAISLLCLLFCFHSQDPMPYLSKYMDGPVHGIFATDSLETGNVRPEDQGGSLEAMVDRADMWSININTGE